MTQLYPLRFRPLLRRYLWGGRRLGEVLGKLIGEGDDYAESWEIVDHGNDQSVVAFGSLAGKTLHDIVAEHHLELFGRHSIRLISMPGGRKSWKPPQFPLLFKLLDCNRQLSVQVHPNDAQAAQLDPPDLGKTEAWVILAAEPGSVIYAGLKPGVDRNTLAREVAAGRTEECLHQFQPRPGDCVFIPAGIIHALGAGLLVAEIQQASDTTFRLFDWNRLGPDDRPRALHVDQSLSVIDFARGAVQPQQPRPISPGIERLVECDKFILDRRTLSGTAALGGDERFHIVCVLAGKVQIEGDPSGQTLKLGQTALLPAVNGKASLQTSGESILLDMYLP